MAIATTTDSPQAEIDLRPPETEAQVTAKEAAQFILAYAKKHRILNTSTEDERADDEYVSEEFARSRHRFESQGVVDALRNREINFVGYDEVRKRVLIFTKKRVTRQFQKILPTAIERQINIEYFEGGVATVGPAPPEIFRSDRYTILNDKFYCCGSSIYPANCHGAGTFGALARDENGTLCGLSNNHVTGACNGAEPGLPILAPGALDVRADGCDPFTIGRHRALLPVHDGHPDSIDISRNLDAAQFVIADPMKVSSMQGSFFDTPPKVIPLEAGMRVEKIGRTTGRTSGEVVAVAGGPTPVGYEIREYGVKKQVYFSPDAVFLVKNRDGAFFSTGGDSGSLVVSVNDDGSRNSVGLVFAGDQRHLISFIIPLDKILEALKVSLVSGHNI
jgi:hypothetical protein